ncbi:hypothetical protein [Nesterenkonia alkaliphila]|uniref:Uncharacterized protein n=1 Tax=Nesterenkonia alkaliphila TaxID=1463631 RepID=A0A7K1UJD4_9MICC|nr:hypothetical protein [Nesterenkonia alkaliphila]MVT26598.1 hypothetical protein [Nesterenkonia alkaliphila]GFZ92105.1 hypothetical protein GCM10011359_21730 [Nesterenkonia alkaliphila]
MALSFDALISAGTQWWPGGGGGETPDLRDGLTEDQITPGIEGFLFTLLVVVMLIFVVRDLAKRARKMKYRSQVEAELSGEEPEFPGEITPASISEAQQHARSSAAEARFGKAPDSVSESEPPAADSRTGSRPPV